MKRRCFSIVLFLIAGITVESLCAEDSTKMSPGKDCNYPLYGLNREEVHKSVIFQKLKKKYEPDFNEWLSGREILSVSIGPDVTFSPLHGGIGKLPDLRRQLMTDTPSEESFDALFVFAICSKECRYRLTTPPFDSFKVLMDFCNMRMLDLILAEAATKKSEDGPFRRACVAAYVDNCSIMEKWRMHHLWVKHDVAPNGESVKWLANDISAILNDYAKIRKTTKDKEILSMLDSAVPIADQQSLGAKTAGAQLSSLSTVTSPNTKKPGFPLFKENLSGPNPIRVVNPGTRNVKVGVRSGEGGLDFEVQAGGEQFVKVPNGKYDIYFIYGDHPETLYRGDSFAIEHNGIEIQLVSVLDGNYSIWEVK